MFPKKDFYNFIKKLRQFICRHKDYYIVGLSTEFLGVICEVRKCEKCGKKYIKSI